jgi:hypothetical protein
MGEGSGVPGVGAAGRACAGAMHVQQKYTSVVACQASGSACQCPCLQKGEGGRAWRETIRPVNC